MSQINNKQEFIDNDPLDEKIDTLKEDQETLLFKCKTAIEELHWELEKAQKVNEEYEQQVFTLNSDIQDLTVQLQKANQQQEFTNQSLHEEKTRNEECQQKIYYLENQAKLKDTIEKQYEDLNNKFSVMCDLNTEQKLKIGQQQNDLVKFQELQEEWQSTINQVNNQIEQLKIDNQELIRENSRQELEIKDLDKINKLLQDSEHQQKIVTKKLHNQIEELQLAIQNYEKVQEENQHTYSGKIQKLSNKQKELEAINDEIRAENLELKDSLIKLEKKAQKFEKTSIEKQQIDLTEIQNLKTAHNKEMDKLQRVIDEQNTIIKQYEMVVDISKGQSVDRQEFLKLAEKNGYLKNRLEECQKELKKLYDDVETQFLGEENKNIFVEKRICELEAQMIQKDNIIENQIQKIAQLDKSNDEIYRQYKKHENLLIDLEHKLRIKDKAMGRMSQDTQQQHQSLNNAGRENIELKKEIELLNTKLSQQQEIIYQNEKMLQSNNNKNSLIKLEQEDEVRELRQQLNLREKENSTLRKKYDDSVVKILQQRVSIEKYGSLLEGQSQPKKIKKTRINTASNDILSPNINGSSGKNHIIDSEFDQPPRSRRSNHQSKHKENLHHFSNYNTLSPKEQLDIEYSDYQRLRQSPVRNKIAQDSIRTTYAYK